MKHQIRKDEVVWFMIKSPCSQSAGLHCSWLFSFVFPPRCSCLCGLCFFHHPSHQQLLSLYRRWIRTQIPQMVSNNQFYVRREAPHPTSLSSPTQTLSRSTVTSSISTYQPNESPNPTVPARLLQLQHPVLSGVSFLCQTFIPNNLVSTHCPI